MAAQASLCPAWSENPQDTFSHDEAHLFPERHMTEKEVAHQEQIDNAPTEERRRGFEERLRVLKRRNIVTSDVNQMAKVLDDQEPVFDELEAQLRRVKQS